MAQTLPLNCHLRAFAHAQDKPVVGAARTRVKAFRRSRRGTDSAIINAATRASVEEAQLVSKLISFVVPFIATSTW